MLYSAWFGKVDVRVHDFLQRLHDCGKTDDEIVNDVFAVVVGASAELAQGEHVAHTFIVKLTFLHSAGLVHVVNFYLEPSRSQQKAEIVKHALSNNAQSAELLEGYVREALRAC